MQYSCTEGVNYCGPVQIRHKVFLLAILVAIGGYESAFLADLVASYTFEKVRVHFHPTIYHGIYMDDGFGGV